MRQQAIESLVRHQAGNAWEGQTEELVGESDTSKPLNPRFFVFLRTTGALMTTYTILGVAYCNYSIMGPEALF